MADLALDQRRSATQPQRSRQSHRARRRRAGCDGDSRRHRADCRPLSRCVVREDPRHQSRLRRSLCARGAPARAALPLRRRGHLLPQGDRGRPAPVGRALGAGHRSDAAGQGRRAVQGARAELQQRLSRRRDGQQPAPARQLQKLRHLPRRHDHPQAQQERSPRCCCPTCSRSCTPSSPPTRRNTR